MGKTDKIIYLMIVIISVILFLIFKKNSLIPLIILNLAASGLFVFRTVRKDLFSMGILLLLNYCVYVLYIPIKQINKSYSVKGYALATYRLLGTRILLVCGVIAIVSFIFGYYAFSNLRVNKTWRPGLERAISAIIALVNKIKNSKMGFLFTGKNFSDVLMASGTILLLYGVYKQGGLSYLLSKYVWNSADLESVGIMTTGVQVAYVGVAISLYLFCDRKIHRLRDFLKWDGLYFGIVLTMVKLIQGGRIQILMGFLTLLSIYHYKYRRFRIREVSAAGAIGYVLFGYIGYFRDYKTLIPNNFGTMVNYMLGGSGGLEYFLNSYTNFTMMQIISTHKISYLWGASLLDGILFLIPRFLLPNKEQLLFVTKKLDELNKIKVVSPVGGLNLASQNLMNGYVVYTIIFMFLLGGFTIYMAKKRDSIKDGVLLYSLVLPFLVVSLVRNPIFYTIKELIQFAVIPFIIFRLLQHGGQNVKDNI